MMKMEEHARAVGTEIIQDHVRTLDLASRPFVAECDSGAGWHADAVTHCGDEVALRGLDMFQVSPTGEIERHWLDLSPERYAPSAPCGADRERARRRQRPGRDGARRSVLEQ